LKWGVGGDNLGVFEEEKVYRERKEGYLLMRCKMV